MNKNIYIVSILSLFLMVGGVSVFAESDNNRDARDTSTSVSAVRISSDDLESDNATTSDETSKKEDQDKSVGELHRSEVAKVVQELDKVADKDRKISDDVKTVAQEEKDASEVVKEKMDKVKERSGFKTFFIGSDYKNLGDLRSELTTTKNSLDRLANALEKTTSTTTKAELQAQIYKLSTIRTSAENFVKAEESKFSLFGWLVRMFQ